jgi:DNA-binding CsgD family transcriptional regulator
VQASRNAAEFNDNDRRKMALLLPHLQRALQLRTAFRRHLIERDMAQVAMDRLAIAVILADPTAKVLFANRAAESIFQQADGLAVSDGRLSSYAPATTQTLLRLIGQSCSKENLALGSPLACAFALPRARHAPLSVMVAPLTTGDLITVSDRPMAMVLARDTQQAGASTPEVLQALFGLTRAEGRLASELVEGRGLEEIASGKGVSLNTIRSQAKSLLRKTGTQRQAELVALVHRFVIDL